MKSGYGMAITGALTLALMGLIWLLAAFAPPSTAPALAWETDLNAALASARARDARVLADIHADWCGPCQRMARETYADPRVIRALEAYVLLKIDSDAQAETAARLSGSSFLPATVLLAPKGDVLARVSGFLDADALLQFLEDAPAGTTQEYTPE